MAFFNFFIGLLVYGLILTLIGLNEPLSLGWHTPLLIYTGGILAIYQIAWLRGQFDTFDPLGLFSIFAGGFFVVIPSLQIGWDLWPYIEPLTNEREYFFIWALMNAAGLSLIAYLNPLQVTPQKLPLQNQTQPLALDLQRFNIAILVMGFLCLGAFIYVLSRFGGIEGYIAAYSQLLALGRSEYDPLAGLGIPMLLADNFRGLATIAALVWFRHKPWAKSRFGLALFMLMLMPIYLTIGAGLHGSRAAVVFSLIGLVIGYHLLVKPLSRAFLLIGVVGFMFLMTILFFYKFDGINALSNIFDAQYRAAVQDARNQEALSYVLVRDIARLDIQLLAMKAYATLPLDYSWGRSYLTAPFAIVPSIFFTQPAPITLEKTNILFGPGAYQSGMSTPILLGQTGEMFVNFSYFGFLLSFVLMGLFLRWLQNFYQTRPTNDPQRLWLPVLVILPILLLIFDSNVIVMHLTRYLLLPYLLILYAQNLKLLPKV